MGGRAAKSIAAFASSFDHRIISDAHRLALAPEKRLGPVQSGFDMVGLTRLQGSGCCAVARDAARLRLSMIRR